MEHILKIKFLLRDIDKENELKQKMRFWYPNRIYILE